MHKKPYAAPGARVLYLTPQASVLGTSFVGPFRSKWFSQTFEKTASDVVTHGTWGSGESVWKEDGYKLP